MAEQTAVTNTVEAIPVIFKESKAGYKTTEFWLMLATSLLVMIDGIPLPEQYEGFVAAAIAAIYALSRGIAKNGAPNEVVTEPVAVPVVPPT